MQSAIYQLTLVIGLAMLAILLIRGYSLQEALIRSGLVLVAVLFLLIIAGNILRLSMRSREAEEGETAESFEPETESFEPEAGAIEPVEDEESEGSQATGT